MEHIANSLITGFQKYFSDNNFSKAVVGISGGVDSAVTATIAERALGKENVYGVLMPYTPFSSEENLEDAKKMVEFLGIPSEIVEIDSFVEEFLKVKWVSKDMTKGNILARVRMILLYSLANEKNALVLGTCNKSETLLGYETKFGDGACDISVIGDLWKTEMWSLAKYFGLPSRIITKAPSAELFENHTDEEEMGFSYYTADVILQKWEAGESLDESDEIVAEILHRIKIHEHKRTIAPTLLRE